MVRTNKWLASGIAFVFTVSTVGCGQGFRTTSPTVDGTTSESVNNGSGTSVTSADLADQLAKAQAANEDAKAAFADAQAALSGLYDGSGNINLGLFSSSDTQTQGLLAPIVDKLNTVFDAVFAKINQVKQQFDTARAAAAAAVAQLNQNDPAQAALYQQAMAQLSQIDAMETQFQTMIHGLASQLDVVSAALNNVVNSATSLIPIPGLGSLAGVLINLFVMSDVQNLISSVKAKLLAV